MGARPVSVWVMGLLVGLLGIATSGLLAAEQAETARSFTIDYENDQFLKDGKPFRYVSGSIHYFRVLPTEWRDRLRKMRMAGFNALETYVYWAGHEPEEGQYEFSGLMNLTQYINIAQEEDLLVILRLGPYMDAEIDMGGLPYWLLNKNIDMHLRSSDPTYLKYVDAWWSNVLLPKVKPLLYENGGPIIMLQVENEYGSYPACDFAYTGHLRDLVRSGLGVGAGCKAGEGEGPLLFTTDGAGVGFLKCGKIPGVYATVDFGPGSDVKKAFAPMRLFEPRGPLVNSEYYPGWLDHWGDPHSTTATEVVVKSLDDILALNASVNMYVFHGGTSFGFSSGANLGKSYQACPTSYDYDAPLSEAGDPTEKYWAIRTLVGKYLPLPSGDVPPPSPKHRYGKVSVAAVGSVLQLAGHLQSVTSPWPLTFEQLLMPNGLVMYQTELPFRIADPARLTLSDIHDRGYVFVDKKLVGMVSREQDMYDLAIYAQPNQTITVLVESQGRICFGQHINDFKGITTNVTLSGHTLKNWSMTPLPLTNLNRLAPALNRLRRHATTQGLSPHQLQGTNSGGMTLYRGSFIVPHNFSHPMDTFLRLDGWSKGFAWVNDFFLGRYWPEVGPQVTLYVPRGVLSQGTNNMTLLELEAAPCLAPDTCYVTLEDKHVIDGPTPQ